MSEERIFVYVHVIDGVPKAVTDNLADATALEMTYGGTTVRVPLLEQVVV